MKNIYSIILAFFLLSQGVFAQIITHSNGEIEIPNVTSNAGPFGAGSLLWFSSGSTNTVIQENWGLNLIGEATKPVKIYNASLLVGYFGGGVNYGTNNAYISGNVGIGTTNPSSKLTLAGSGNANPNTGSEVDYAGQSLTFRGENAGGSFNLGNVKMVQPNGYYVDAADMVFLTAPGGGSITEKMRIKGNGSVGIGTSNPQGYMLAINGSAIATSITVKLYANWPDYVFKKDYQIPSLSDIKTYIDKNQRLPEMPSEEQVAKDGLNLGEMNILLVKKVEELTLYLIEKDKKEQEQGTLLKNQQTMLLKQQAQIDKLDKEFDELSKKQSVKN
jgi:hypothetical protein